MSNLNNRQIEKYSRQIMIDKIGLEGQKKICDASICIIGCGGLGTSAAQYLVMSGINKVLLVDNDKVSLSNLNRQTLFYEKDIGKSKVEVLSSKLNKINPSLKIEIKKKKITRINIKKTLLNYKIVLDCTDNFKSRYLINEHCFNYKKILVSAALQNFDLQAFAFSAWKKKNLPCYNCIFPNLKTNEENSCDSLGIIAPVAGLGGLIQAMLVIKVILSSSEKIFKELILFDSFNNNFRKIKTTKNSSCKICN